MNEGILSTRGSEAVAMATGHATEVMARSTRRIVMSPTVQRLFTEVCKTGVFHSAPRIVLKRLSQSLGSRVGRYSAPTKPE